MKIILESIDEINEFYENWNGVPNVHETTEKETKTSNSYFREYGKTNKLPAFIDVTPNGAIKLRHGYAKGYDIHTVLDLKGLIPLVDEYPSWDSLKKAVGTKVDKMTVKRICYVIEQGGAEFVINKWDNTTPKYDKYGQVIE